MKKIILSILGLALVPLVSIAQSQNSAFDPGNTRPGESVEYCLTHKKYAEMLQNPSAVQSLAEDQLISAAESQEPQLEGVTYYIPVVFHLLHNNGVEKISEDQILDAFAILNRDYDLQNTDANSVANAFNASNPLATTIPADVDIEFVLATKAPNGTCFSGITRTQSSLTTVTSSQQGGDQVNAIRTGNDIYQGEWPGNKYLNIFICEDIGGAAGYTYKPSNWIGTGMGNGIWVRHDYVGSIGTSSGSSSRTLTHEVGHWLNLDHLWGGTNNPAEPQNCNSDDEVSDTPDCLGLTSCNLNSNTCNGDNSYWGFDQIDNTENYMEYSYCSKMFTPGQVTRMRNALNSSVGGRNNVKSASNLAATGADGNTYLCKADFEANKFTVCVGETIDFTDLSYNEVTGWSWSFPGGTPSTSAVQNPTITYNTPGVYEVTLDATDGSTNDSEVKSAYIRVLPAPASIPFLETFETLSTLSNITEWEVIDYGNNAEFELTTSAGHTGSNSAKLLNYGQAAGNFDELVSSTVDLSSITSNPGVTLSFRYAYSKRQSGNDEWLRVFISKDCGDSWAQRKTIHGSALGSNISNTNWTPSESDWVTIHMTNVTSAYWTSNFKYKFQFESDGGNNFYLDDINIYPGSPSDDLILGVDERAGLGHLTLFPNPVEDELNVRFDLNNAQQVEFLVQDIAGKVVQSRYVQGQTGANLVVLGTEGISSGMYFLQIRSGGTQQSIQFVVK
jgi:PKD repeat protein